MILVGALVFVAVVGLVVAIWWALASGSVVRARLAPQGPMTAEVAASILRTVPQGRFPLLSQITALLPVGQKLERLTEQAGWRGQAGAALGAIIALGIAGGAIGAIRVGGWLAVLALAIAGGAIPVIYLRIRAHKRLEKFTEQFPDALDMVTRALRAGYAFGSAIQLVCEEMPDPIGPEFRRIFEEISLGTPPTETVAHLHDRINTEDVRFFYVAVSIQREVGGNLAEILDQLSKVIRERFKILSYARVLSAQQRGTAYCVSVSPIFFALLIYLLTPGFYDAMFEAKETLLGLQIGKALIFVALALQAAGFLILKRIANITV